MQDNRLRILYLISGLAVGDRLGGAERFGMDLAMGLDLERFEPLVCGFWRYELPSELFWQERLAAAGVKSFFAVERGGGFSPIRYWQGLRAIRRACAGRPVDVIHSHFQLGSIAALTLRRALGARALVRTAHGLVPWEWSRSFHGFWGRRIFTEGVFPLGFDREVGVSQAVVDSLDGRWGARLRRARAELIYNAVDFGRLEAGTVDDVSRLRQALGLTAADVVIGSVGRLSEQKGYLYLLEALPGVVSRYPTLKVLLVGDGELREALQQKAAQLGVAEHVRFLGRREDVAALLQLMEVFVLPSLWEGLPTVVLESMAGGTPVIATDIPGTRELVHAGQTGWLVPPQDPDRLAEALSEVLADAGARKQICRAARSYVRQHFAIQSIAAQHQTLYEKLTGQAPGD